jgi:predicted NBD/HSP70 family sugar kinase
VARLLFDPTDRTLRKDARKILVIDRGGTNVKFGIYYQGQIIMSWKAPANTPGRSFYNHLAEFLDKVMLLGVVVDAVQLISSGVVATSPEGELCIIPQNGQRELINLARVSSLAGQMLERHASAFLANDVEGLVALVQADDTDVVPLFGPLPDPTGSRATIMCASGMGGGIARRLPFWPGLPADHPGLLAYTGEETTGHGYLPETIPPYLAIDERQLASDYAALYSYVTHVLGRRWDVELAGGSATGLVYAYQVIRGDRTKTEPNPGQGKVIADLAQAGDAEARRAMRVATFALSCAIFTAALANVTGGVRLCGEMITDNYELFMALGLERYVTSQAANEPYGATVVNTPVGVTFLPQDWSLIAAGLTAITMLRQLQAV